MNPALYGIIGVIIGSLVTGGTQLVLAYRADRRAARGAARLVGAEFSRARVTLERMNMIANSGNAFSPGNLHQRLSMVYPGTLWEEHQHVLATALTRNEWIRAEEANRELRAFQQANLAPVESDSDLVYITDDFNRELVRHRTYARNGFKALSRLIGVPKRRFRRALSHLPYGSKLVHKWTLYQVGRGR